MKLFSFFCKRRPLVAQSTHFVLQHHLGGLDCIDVNANYSDELTTPVPASAPQTKSGTEITSKPLQTDTEQDSTIPTLNATTITSPIITTYTSDQGTAFSFHREPTQTSKEAHPLPNTTMHQANSTGAALSQ